MELELASGVGIEGRLQGYHPAGHERELWGKTVRLQVEKAVGRAWRLTVGNTAKKAAERPEARAIFKREWAKTGELLPTPAARAKRGEVRRHPRELYVHLISAVCGLRCSL